MREGKATRWEVVAVRSAIEVFQEVMALPENEQRALLDYLLRRFGYPDPRAFLPWDDLEDEEIDRAYERLAGDFR